jgi:hypothetical protein
MFFIGYVGRKVRGVVTEREKSMPCRMLCGHLEVRRGCLNRGCMCCVLFVPLPRDAATPHGRSERGEMFRSAKLVRLRRLGSASGTWNMCAMHH